MINEINFIKTYLSKIVYCTQEGTGMWNIYISALLLGLLGEVHCVGMCGPIALILPVDRRN